MWPAGSLTFADSRRDSFRLRSSSRLSVFESLSATAFRALASTTNTAVAVVCAESLPETLKPFPLLMTTLTGLRAPIRLVETLMVTCVLAPKAGGNRGCTGFAGGTGLTAGEPPVDGDTACATLVCDELPAGFEALAVQRYSPAAVAVWVLPLAPGMAAPSRVQE